MYLNGRPISDEMKRNERNYQSAVFLGCAEAVYCCKIQSENRPKSLKEQFFNRKDGTLAVISFKARCRRDVHIWHWFARRLGANNYLTLADFSTWFTDILTGKLKSFL